MGGVESTFCATSNECDECDGEREGIESEAGAGIEYEMGDRGEVEARSDGDNSCDVSRPPCVAWDGEIEAFEEILRA